jgi:hypothetical protein
MSKLSHLRDDLFDRLDDDDDVRRAASPTRWPGPASGRPCRRICAGSSVAAPRWPSSSRRPAPTGAIRSHGPFAKIRTSSSACRGTAPTVATTIPRTATTASPPRAYERCASGSAPTSTAPPSSPVRAIESAALDEADRRARQNNEIDSMVECVPRVSQAT